MTFAWPWSAPDTDARPLLSSIAALRAVAVAILGMGAAAAVAQTPGYYPPPASDTIQRSFPSSAGPFRNDAAIASAIAQWNQLRQTDGLSFTSYASFLVAHPGWPGDAALRKAPERALAPDSAMPGVVVSSFQKFPPQSPAAWLRYAEASDTLGQRTQATEAARRAWWGGALSIDDETRLLGRFGSSLTTTDHDIRMDRLLWQRATTLAMRELPLTSAVRQPLFSTRLAFLTKAPDASSRAAYVAQAGATDAGYIIDRAFWLRATGQEYAAQALLAAPRTLTLRPTDPEKWLESLLSSARNAVAGGQFRTAYDIAHQVDDIYPAGTVIRDRPLGERDLYTSLVWLAGLTALEQLRQPLLAQAMFDRYSAAAKTPQTQTKGYYWAGRAAQSAGNPVGANEYWTRAATYFDQFYGQLAAERLGIALTIPPVTRTIEISQSEREAFANREIVRAAVYLGQTGDWTTQSLFVRQIAQVATTDSDHLFANELSIRLARPDLGVMVGRSAGVNGLRDYVRAGFPVVPVPLERQSDWTIIHAIARQESQFDRKIVSKAGARGVMQLMPATAAEQAAKIGIGYSSEQLYDAVYNMRLGAAYFGRLMDRYGGNYVLAVAAYNAGAGNVNK